MVRRNGRVDLNQNQIVADLRRAGLAVVVLSAVSNGCPDLLVGGVGRWVLLEVKSPGPPSARRLTAAEKGFHDLAHSRGLPCAVVSSSAEAIEYVLKVHGKAAA